MILEDRDPALYETVLSGNYAAAAESAGLCPQDATGDCFVMHETPGCDNEICCNAVCAILRFCCLNGWNEQCVDQAEVNLLCTAAFTAAFHVVTANAVNLTARLDGFTITGGSAEGVGIDSLGGGMLVVSAGPGIVRCRFESNNAVDGGGAVGIDLSGGSVPRFVNCEFVANTTDGFGGAISAERDVFFTNCLFSGNTAGQDGGAIQVVGGVADVFVKNCTFSDNVAQSDGGGISSGAGAGTMLVVTNSVLWGNHDSTGMTEDAQIFRNVGATVDVDYSCIQGLTGGLGGTGNIGDDPMFENPVTGGLSPEAQLAL